jgi:hypothetical protein
VVLNKLVIDVSPEILELISIDKSLDNDDTLDSKLASPEILELVSLDKSLDNSDTLLDTLASPEIL